MPKSGFRMNYRTVGKILKSTTAPQLEVAKKILDKVNEPEARIAEYTTDRNVAGVVVPADSQAKHGSATRAAQQVASES